MRRSGFTAIELMIVLSISAIIVPSIYVFSRNLEQERAVGLWHLQVSDETQSVAEALRADRRTLGFSSAQSLHFEGRGACSPIAYALTPDHTIVRRAPASCGAETTLATHVTALTRAAGGVALTFAFETRPEQWVKTEVFIAVED